MGERCKGGGFCIDRLMGGRPYSEKSVFAPGGFLGAPYCRYCGAHRVVWGNLCIGRGEYAAPILSKLGRGGFPRVPVCRARGGRACGDFWAVAISCCGAAGPGYAGAGETGQRASEVASDGSYGSRLAFRDDAYTAWGQALFDCFVFPQHSCHWSVSGVFATFVEMITLTICVDGCALRGCRSHGWRKGLLN